MSWFESDDYDEEVDKNRDKNNSDDSLADSGDINYEIEDLFLTEKIIYSREKIIYSREKINQLRDIAFWDGKILLDGKNAIPNFSEIL